MDDRGLLVGQSFADRLRAGDKHALRALAKQNLTFLYRRGYSRLTRGQEELGLFYSEPLPDMVRIPLFKGGRHRVPAWLDDGEAIVDEGCSEHRIQFLLGMAEVFRQGLPLDRTIHAQVKGDRFMARYKKANPCFELVVINKHDRGALLKLLAEIDAITNVERWMAARTRRAGATAPSELHADYVAWCAREDEIPSGMKGFAQALVTTGIKKLPRSAGGVRYELDLR